MIKWLFFRLFVGWLVCFCLSKCVQCSLWREIGMKQRLIVWSNLDVQKQHDWTMVTAKDLWPHEAVNDFRFEIFRNDCVIQTPSDILFAISTHVRPESVWFIFVRVYITECIDETKRKQIGHPLTFLWIELHINTSQTINFETKCSIPHHWIQHSSGWFSDWSNLFKNDIKCEQIYNFNWTFL